MPNDLTTVDGLVDAHQRLDSLRSCAQWAQAAQMYLGRLRGVEDECETALKEVPHLIEDADVAARKRPLWKRLFRTKEQKEVVRRAQALRERRQQAGAARESIQSLVDETPTNAAERNAMLKELKESKKGLQLDKRELSSHLRDIRATARRETASAGSGFFALTTGAKYTAAERRQIRAAKERAVASPEQAKRVIEKQLLALDRKIARVESFG